MAVVTHENEFSLPKISLGSRASSAIFYILVSLVAIGIAVPAAIISMTA